ncbi:MAG TPA: exodeoxyribonuclease V subunit alpha [Deltaproteobacteria bacterium]|nr:exodeoxyribonuclease V subunit alpha [Deltaproteobacteria bacterium]
MNKRNTITDIVQSGMFSEIDIHFARFVTRIDNKNDPDIFLGAALVSHVTGNGDVCLDLFDAKNQLISAFADDQRPFKLPAPNEWEEKLISSRVVGRPGEVFPLILDKKGRLYLSRYFDYEISLSETIKEKAGKKIEEFDSTRLSEGLKRLFPAEQDRQPNRQKIAALVAVLNQFSIISGGPGTGKTFAVAKILALLLEQSPLRIALAAPTGKAAARLTESIEAAKRILNTSDTVLSQIPSEALTIHRLLKSIYGTPYFHHNAENLLPFDVVVVDEASMVDLALISKLIQAIPPEARLILIGDKDQLASVEAGSVLGDFCDRDRIHEFSEPFRNTVIQITGEPFETAKAEDGRITFLKDNIAILMKSYRFNLSSGIGGFSRAVNAGDVESSIGLLEKQKDTSLEWRPVANTDQLHRLLRTLVLDDYNDYLESKDPLETIQRFNGTQFICALNRGPYGVIEINRFIEQVLRKAGRIFYDYHHPEPWYDKRPIMITRNDYELGLYNGDIGITLSGRETDDPGLYVYFPGAGTGDGLKAFNPHRLPEHETVYAMTVHKSQGSEFDHVILVLPDKNSPVLTRELIYTAVTRARKRVSILGSETVLRWAISRKIRRTSGLRDALWE